MSGDPTGPAEMAGREHKSGRMSQGLKLRKQHQCESTEDVSSHGFHLGWWPSVTAIESRKLNGLMVPDRTMACSPSHCPQCAILSAVKASATSSPSSPSCRSFIPYQLLT